MSRQYFRDTIFEPMATAYATITATTETVLIPTLSASIAGNEPRTGKTYKLTVGGTLTTGVAGTLTITPRYGLTIGGVALGGSPAQNYVPSVTLAPFLFEYWLTFRKIGQAGANSVAVGAGRFTANGAVATAGSSTLVTCASTGDVAVDASIASGLWIGLTFSVAPSLIPHFSAWESLN